MQEQVATNVDLEQRFREARLAAEERASTFDSLLNHCPACGPDQGVAVVRLTGMDGKTYEGDWRLSSDGFAWGADSNGDGSSWNEVVRCHGCGLERPLSDYVLYQDSPRRRVNRERAALRR